MLPEYLKNLSPLVLAHARESAGLTQAQAAATVYLSGQTRWAEYESGARNIDPARYELFLLLTGQHPIYRPLVRARPTRVPAAFRRRARPRSL
jgi:transcriptional regulator with XRE-family HTH domain